MPQELLVGNSRKSLIVKVLIGFGIRMLLDDSYQLLYAYYWCSMVTGFTKQDSCWNIFKNLNKRAGFSA